MMIDFNSEDISI